MGRSPCCEKVGLKKGPWTSDEDQKLLAYIEEHGHGSWRALPAGAGLQRCGKSCRLRWANYLRPDIKRGKFSLQEEQTIIQLHALLGNRWSAIALHLSKRTDNEIKNYWNTNLKKRLTKMGIDPITHKPKCDSLGGLSSGQSKGAANLSHMAQWESARLEAEARLVRQSKSAVYNNLYQSRRRLDSSSLASTNQLRTNEKPLLKMPPILDVLKAWQSPWTMTRSAMPPSPYDNQNNNYHANAAIRSSFLNSTNATLLESPTSTLNFSRNTELAHDVFNKVHVTKQDVQDDMNCFKGNYQDMVLAEEMTYPIDSTYISDIDDALCLPSIMENFPVKENLEGGTSNLINNDNLSVQLENDEIGSCSQGDIEDSKNYWNNILSLVSDSPVF